VSHSCLSTWQVVLCLTHKRKIRLSVLEPGRHAAEELTRDARIPVVGRSRRLGLLCNKSFADFVCGRAPSLFALRSAKRSPHDQTIRITQPTPAPTREPQHTPSNNNEHAITQTSVYVTKGVCIRDTAGKPALAGCREDIGRFFSPWRLGICT